MTKERISVWMAQVRGNFLVLSVILVSIGLAMAGRQIAITGDGSFSAGRAVLLMIGVVLAHASVNLFNEYSDYLTGIDSQTKKTPFSGGSGMLQAGKTTPEAVLTAAWHTLFFACLIGLFFALMSHWVILPIMAVGGAAVVLYTRHLARWLLGELFAGLSLGSLVVLGSFIAMTATPALRIADVVTCESILVSFPPGILTALLLFLNEFPDLEADRAGGRFHLVILLGRRKSAVLYCIGLCAVYASIVALPLSGAASPWILVACATAPIAARAGLTAIRFSDDTDKLMPALGMNVVVVLATDLLLAVGIVVETLIR